MNQIPLAPFGYRWLRRDTAPRDFAMSTLFIARK